MKKSVLVSICIIFFLLIPLSDISCASGANNDMNVFYGNVYDQALNIRKFYLHSSGALKNQQVFQQIDAKTNCLTASTLFSEYKRGGSNDLLHIAQNIIKGSTEKFDEAYSEDNFGWVSFYDFAKQENSYVKSRKYTHDQVLMALCLVQSYLNSNNEYTTEYLSGISETNDFIKRNLLGDSSGWYDSVFLYNRTSYSRNEFRIIENICWTIWAVLNTPEDFESPISLSTITHIMDNIDENCTYRGAVFNVMSSDWESSDTILKLRTNALYGIINLILYEKTSDTRFLNRGKAVFDRLITNNFYDRWVGGFFDIVDEDGLILVQRKSTIGNALACLLSSRLCRYFPSNDTLLTTYVRTNRFIEEKLRSGNNDLYYVTCERNGYPVQLYRLESDLIRLWQSSNSLHIINGSLDSQVSIGERVKIDLNIHNVDNLNYTLLIEGEEIETYNQTSSDSHLSFFLDLKNNAEIGYSNLNIQIKVLSGIVDSQDSIVIKIGSDRKIPQGLVYLVAIGILVGIVVIIRYPPQYIVEVLTRITSLSVIPDENNESLNESIQNNISNSPQSED